MPEFMPENFAVPQDARLTLAMLRMPPNLNVELFEWSSSDRRTEHPRHSDAGGHHLCFVVDDVDEAVAVLRDMPGRARARRPQGGRRRQPPRRGQPMDLLPHAVGTADGARRPFAGWPTRPPWSAPPTGAAAADDNTSKGPVTMRTCRPHPRNPGADRPGGARAVRGRRARRRRGDLPGRLPLGAAAARPALRRGGPAGVRGPGSPDRRADAVHDGDQRPRRRPVADGGRRVPRRDRDRAGRGRRPAPRLCGVVASGRPGPRGALGPARRRPFARWRRKRRTPGYASASRTTSAP